MICESFHDFIVSQNTVDFNGGEIDKIKRGLNLSKRRKKQKKRKYIDILFLICYNNIRIAGRTGSSPKGGERYGQKITENFSMVINSFAVNVRVQNNGSLVARVQIVRLN